MEKMTCQWESFKESDIRKERDKRQGEKGEGKSKIMREKERERVLNEEKKPW